MREGRDGSPQDPARPGAEHVLPHLPRPAPVCTSDSVVTNGATRTYWGSSGPGTGHMPRKCSPGPRTSPALPVLPGPPRHRRAPAATSSTFLPTDGNIVSVDRAPGGNEHHVVCSYYRVQFRERARQTRPAVPVLQKKPMRLRRSAPRLGRAGVELELCCAVATLTSRVPGGPCSLCVLPSSAS